MFAYPPMGLLIPLVGKFWGFSGDFYEKSPEWVWAKPTTFSSATFHTTRTNLTPLISRMCAMAASEGAGAASMTV